MTTYNFIKSFVNNIDSAIQIEFDKNFCVNIDEKIVYVECYEHEKNNLIQDFVEENFNIIIDPFLIGLLHEIGHIFTFDILLDEERTIQYLLLQLLYEEDEFKTYSYKYFSLPAEYKATEWAVNYYKQHKELCDNFLNELYSDN